MKTVRIRQAVSRSALDLMSELEQKPLLSRKEVAAATGLGTTAVKAMEKLLGVKLAGRYYIKLSDLKRFLETSANPDDQTDSKRLPDGDLP